MRAFAWTPLSVATRAAIVRLVLLVLAVPIALLLAPRAPWMGAVASGILAALPPLLLAEVIAAEQRREDRDAAARGWRLRHLRDRGAADG